MKLYGRITTKFTQILLFSIALNSIVFNFSRALTIKRSEKGQFLERAVFALEKVLFYYDHNYETITIDSLLGIRVAEGILLKIVTDNKHDILDIGKMKLIFLIEKMHRSAKRISNKSLSVARDDNIKAFQMFYKIISKPWKLFHRFQKMNRKNSGLKKPLKNIMFDGPTSDHCISLLLKDKDGYGLCNITDSCWQFETQKYVDGYTPTHQVLYFLFGLSESCGDAIKKKFQGTGFNDTQEFLLELCENILQTAEQLWQDDNVLEYEKDLFMEQSLVCSLAGYEDFLNERYLNTILKWQIGVGCFGTKVHAKQSTRTLRKPRYAEKLFKDGCLNHETGVAVALLAQYIRWILETK
ncbi:UPF0764 protein C16orf89 homolog [Dendronephthya gigantea]|uniref:UPF0764 protein C16orf89 homolog n=1 Tax=Dendronephthya gigantea TaxID=151771 RepID=UPI00106ACE74|nr:UPF0764 protein C16orf89 homolog [Dendronephthya gigantea]XP_028403288.1 UPF0764 protein C16orf89 homolog [Dendronephthya gigantea]